MKDPGNGLFVVFEGIDGSGKSTLSRAWADHIAGLGVRAPLHLAFPSHDGPVGELIRKGFSGEVKLSEEVYGYLMMADCIDRQGRIYHAVKEGRVVVADRYAPISGWAYQQEVFAVDAIPAFDQRHRLIQPTVTFIINVSPETAAKRMEGRGAKRNETFEKDDGKYIVRLTQRYLAYALNEQARGTPVVILDGEKSIDALISDVTTSLAGAFGLDEKGNELS